MRLFTLFSVPGFLTAYGKLLLTVIGIALGIALFTAVRLANETAIKSFAHNQVVFTNDFPLRVYAPGRQLPAVLYPALRQSPYIADCTPIGSELIDVPVTGGKRIRVRLYGVDILRSTKATLQTEQFDMLQFLRTDNAVLVSEVLHSDLSATNLILAQYENKNITLHSAGVISAASMYERRYLLTDIGQLQHITGRPAEIEAFLIKPEGVSDPETVRKQLSDILPPDVIIESTGQRSVRMEKTTASFRLNIQFLTLFSLLVAIVLVYTFISSLTVARRQQFGVLRSLGVPPQTIFRTVLFEGLLLGAIGGLIGCLLGAYVARSIVDAISTTINTLYAPAPALEVLFIPVLYLESILIGMCSGMLGALLPAIEAYRARPVALLSYQHYETKFTHRAAYLVLPGLFLTLIAVILSRSSILSMSLLAGFMPPICFIAGTLCMIPFFTAIIIEKVHTVASAQYLSALVLACGHIQATLRRSAVSIAAVAMTIGMVLSVSIMIHSFRTTVENWIYKITTADMYISAGTSDSARLGAALPAGLESFSETMPEVDAVDIVHAAQINLAGVLVEVRGVRFAILEKYKRLPVIAGSIPETLQLERDTGFISEALAQKLALQPGDPLSITTPTGAVTLNVQGVYEDYSSEHGVILVAAEKFRTLFHDQSVRGVSLYLKPGSTPDAVAQQLYTAYPEESLYIQNRDTLRSYVLAVFTETFRVTYALQFIAVILAVFIIINTALILLLERADELSMLYAIGVTRQRLCTIASIESLLIAVVATGFGAYLGFGLSLFLVYVVNVHFFGWLVSFVIPWKSIGILLFLVQILAALAGFLSALYYMTTTFRTVNRYE